MKSTNGGSMSELHIACERGDSKQITFLLSSENINSQNRDGETPLHIASKYDRLNAVKVLTSRKECNFNITNGQGYTPLHTACKQGHLSIVQFLVADQRCQLNTKNSEMNTLLHIACHTKALRIIGLLLKTKCSTNIPNKKGETAEEIPLNEDGDCLLHIACQWGDAAIVRYFITHQRCNQNIMNHSRSIPLHTVSKLGHLDTVWR